MAAVKIGANAAILSSRENLDAAVGQKVAVVINALRDIHAFKLMLDGLADADLKALGYGDGTNSTANEIGYLRSGLVAATDLDLIRLGQTPQQTQPHNYQADLAYLSPN